MSQDTKSTAKNYLSEQFSKVHGELFALRDIEKKITYLRIEQERIESVQKYIAELEKENTLLKLGKKKAKSGYTVLIDGSASMLNHASNQKESCIELALQGAQNIAALGKPGTTNVILFGDEKPLAIDLADKKQVEIIAKESLNCGSDLSYAIDPVRLNQHVIIVSDGDIFDNRRAQPLIEQFLSSSPTATVDFIIVGDYQHTAMSNMAAEVKVPTEAQKPLVSKNVKDAEHLNVVIGAVLTTRNGMHKKPARKPKAAKPAQ